MLVLTAGAFCWFWLQPQGTTPVRYVLGEVRRGDLVISVSGTGQVAAGAQVDLKPKVSGDVTALMVSEGQSVRAGTLIAQLDATDAQKAVRDAQVNLESAQLSLDKLKQSTADINSLLEDAFADISNAFLDFPTVVAGAEQIMLGSTIAVGQGNAGFYADFVGQLDDANYPKIRLIVDTAEADHRSARAQYDAVLVQYKNVSRYAEAAAIEDLLTQTLATAKAIAQALKSEQNVLDFLSDYATARNKILPSLITTYKSNLRTYIGQVNGHIASLAAAANTIANAPLDIRSQELSVKQRENALSDARVALASYSIRAPFDGVIADLPLAKGDPASPGSIIATLISGGQVATIALNEVDVAQVVVGQPVTLTFDAINEYAATGTVAAVGTIGAVSQGVVTYEVEVSFVGDARIRPGMSVAATIATRTISDVILVPSSAVKSQGREQYVEVVARAIGERPRGSAATASDVTPERRLVTVGASNDIVTEIIAGLDEGESVVVRTIAEGAAGTASAPTGGFGGVRIPGVTGGGVRTFTR